MERRRCACGVAAVNAVIALALAFAAPVTQGTIKGPVCFVKISQEDSPTQVAVLSAFLANGRR